MKSKNWLTLDEILVRWDTVEFDLLNAIKKGLPAYLRSSGKMLVYGHHTGFKIKNEGHHPPGFEGISLEPLILNEQHLSEKLRDPNIFVFKLSDVEGYEKKMGIIPRFFNIEPQISIDSIIDPDVDYSKLKPLDKGRLARAAKKAGFEWREIASRLCKKDMERVNHGMKEWDTIKKRITRWAREAGYNPKN